MYIFNEIYQTRINKGFNGLHTKPLLLQKQGFYKKLLNFHVIYFKAALGIDILEGKLKLLSFLDF